MTTETKATSVAAETILTNVCGYYKNFYDKAFTAAKRQFLSDKDAEEQATKSARVELEKLGVLKGRTPKVLLDAVTEPAWECIDKNPGYGHCKNAYDIIQQALKLSQNPQVTYSAIDAFIAVYMAAEEAEKEDKKWFHGSGLFRILRTSIQGWYAGTSTTGRLAVEVERLKTAAQETQRLQERLRALENAESKAKADAESAHREVGELKKALAKRDDEVQSIGVPSVAPSMMSAAGATKKTQLYIDSRVVEKDGKTTPQTKKAAFYLQKIVKRAEESKEVSKARKLLYARSIETSYELLCPFIGSDGIVAIPASHPESRVLTAHLAALAENLDILATMEAVEHHASKTKAGYKEPDFNLTIANLIRNFYKKGGSLFPADSSKAAQYKTVWETGPLLPASAGAGESKATLQVDASTESSKIHSVPVTPTGGSRRPSVVGGLEAAQQVPLMADPLDSLAHKPSVGESKQRAGRHSRTGSTTGIASQPHLLSQRRPSGSSSQTGAADDVVSVSGQSVSAASSAGSMLPPLARPPKAGSVAAQNGAAAAAPKGQDELSEAGSGMSKSSS